MGVIGAFPRGGGNGRDWGFPSCRAFFFFFFFRQKAAIVSHSLKAMIFCVEGGGGRNRSSFGILRRNHY